MKSKSGYKYIHLRKDRNCYNVIVPIHGKNIYLGSYGTLKEAVKIRDDFMMKHRASLFFPKKSKTRPGKKRSDNTSGYYGVSYDRRYGYYQICVYYKSQRISLGTCVDPVEAANTVNNFYTRNGELPPNELSKEQVEHIQTLQTNRRLKIEQIIREARLKRPKIKSVKGPEYFIQQKIIKYLEDRGWMVKSLVGTLYQWGLSDLLACHPRYGIKLIEVKNPKRFSFTKAQLVDFPRFNTHGAPIYVLTGANDENYQRLFGKSNLWIYMGKLNEGK